MWSGGISERNPVRPAEGNAQGLTCQTAKHPACHIQNVIASFLIFPFDNNFHYQSESIEEFFLFIEIIRSFNNNLICVSN
jgi:hypothetical protein